MAAGDNSAVPLTAGTGTNIDSFLQASGDHRQAVVIGDATNTYTQAVDSSGRALMILPDGTASGTITVTDAVVGAHAGAGVPLTGTPTASSYVAYQMQGGESGFTLRAGGTFGGGTLWVESSVDSTNGVDGAWITNLMRQSGISQTTLDADITGAGIFRGVAAGYSYMRFRVTGATTPSITIAARFARSPSVTALVAGLPPGANTIGAVSRLATTTQTTLTPATVATTSGQTFQSRIVATALTTGTVAVLAPGAGLSVYVTDFSVSNSGSALTVVSLLPASGTAQLDIVAAASGGGGTMNLNTPMKIAANTALHYAMTVASTSVYINISGFVNA